ncbi:hypothetical protein OFO01_00885 [Campylobacter sp. JMF_01 NE2]|uniref:hypothetical protein n=1 Tax=unclassified Campylobacter TaxID=2593542 RepID=UPI0022E99FA4|nr:MULTISPECIES: hypothetical protein [unclassified Campylobacter]MDA3052011.1 hypothetical protein [Campylobacter sp. JMF_03 NE3]MDA3066345.1 hypothetical protein [Campylobacter sp. JMF_01 NE2]
MDILIVNLIVAFACALCIKYIANSQINKFAKFFALLIFFVFVFFGFFVFVFFLTFLFLALIKKKYRVKIHKIDEKITYEKVEISKNDKFLFASKARFFATLMVLFFTCGFVFDGFKMLKFRYECDIKKNFKIEIVSDDYEIKESDYHRWGNALPFNYDSNISIERIYGKLDSSGGLYHRQNVFYNNNLIAKIYEYFMPYNYFIAKMLSVETEQTGELCGYSNDEILKILEKNLINKNFNEKDKR